MESGWIIDVDFDIFDGIGVKIALNAEGRLEVERQYAEDRVRQKPKVRELGKCVLEGMKINEQK